MISIEAAISKISAAAQPNSVWHVYFYQIAKVE